MIEPRRLAEKLAVLAQNTGFESGALAAATVGTVQSAEFALVGESTRSILRPGNSGTRLAFTSDTTGEAFASLIAPIDKWGRVYYTTAFGPRFTVSDNYTVDALTTNPVSYKLGIPAPKYQPIVGTPAYTMSAGRSADLVKIAYVYTYVDKYGHESAPSAPSTIASIPTNATFTVQLSFVAESLPDTNISGAVKRVYRAAFDGSTSAWQFIADVPLATATWTDTVPFGNEAEALISMDWVQPPALVQMVSMGASFVAGFHDNYACYSELRLPHAWPEAYRYPLRSKIVGMKPTQNGMLIATTGKPYWAFGADPSSAVPVELDANYPCLAAKSIVDMGGYVVYATYDGLVAVSGQDVKVITSEYIDRFTWGRDFAPADIVAFAYEGRYVFSIGSAWWAFDPQDSAGFSTIGNLSVAPTALRQAYYDAKRDTTVLLDTLGKAYDVVSVAGGAFKWVSKTFETPPISFSTARVLATQYPQTLTVTADGAAEVYVAGNSRPFRLKAVSAELWALTVEGSGRVTDVSLCQSIKEL
jgi:hypothetical protein